MGPKKVNRTSGSVKPVSSSMKQIDDFIGQSELQEGEEATTLSLSLQKQRMEELTEKFFEAKNPAIMQRNLRALTEVHTVSTIFIGVAAGIFGFDGLMGVVFYFAMDLCVGLLLVAYFGFKADPYFAGLGQLIRTGLFSNVMTFMVTWVLFHNLVYIL